MLALDGGVLAVVVLVLQLPGDGTGFAGLHVRHGGVQRRVGGVGFRAGGHQHHGVGQRQLGFRQAQHVGGIHGGFDDGDDLRPGQAHILAGGDHQAAAGGYQIAGLQQPGQVMQRRVRVGAAHRLLVGGDDVVMVVALPVVAHGGMLGHLLHHVQRHRAAAVLHRRGGHGKFQVAQRLAHIAAGAVRQIVQRVGGHIDLAVLLTAQADGGIVQALRDILRVQLLELEHGAAGEQGVIDVKIGIFGGGGDQRHGALLDAFQQALLLPLVEILDLVQIQKDTALAGQGAHIGQHRFDVAGGGGGTVELVQVHAAVLGDDARHGGLAHAGRPVKDHIGDAAAVDGAAEHLVLPQKMLLAAYLVQRARPQPLCQWFHVALLPVLWVPPGFWAHYLHYSAAAW